MNLYLAKTKIDYTVRANNVSDARLRFRLLDLGLYKGQKVMMLDKQKNKKNVLILINNIKYMLDVSICEQIEVEDA